MNINIEFNPLISYFNRTLTYFKPKNAISCHRNNLDLDILFIPLNVMTRRMKFYYLPLKEDNT